MINLTKNERLVISFLICVILLGIGVRHYRHIRQEAVLNAENLELDKIIKEKETPININTADFKDFIKLPGIGPKTAEKILEYRQLNNQFWHIEDLKKIKGIGDKKLEKLRKYVTVE